MRNFFLYGGLLLGLLFGYTAKTAAAQYLAIYQADLAFIEESKSIFLQDDTQKLAFGNLAAQLLPETLNVDLDGLTVDSVHYQPDKTALELAVSGKAGQSASLRLNYLTRGLSWQADYVGVIAEATQEMELFCWARLTNKTNLDLTDASVTLFAGAPLKLPSSFKTLPLQETISPARATADFSYTIPAPLSLAKGEIVKVPLLPKVSHVKYQKRYIYEPQAQDAVLCQLEFGNTEANQLAMPLPAGELQLYKKNESHNIFLGSSYLAATPKEALALLDLGPQSRVYAKRVMVSSVTPGVRQREEVYQVTLRNQLAEAVELTIRENLPKTTEITQSSHPYTRDETTLVYQIKLAGNTQMDLNYTLLFKF